MKILMAGTTGLVGSIVRDGLLNDSNVSKIISVQRRPEKGLSPKFQAVTVPVPDLLKQDNCYEGDVAICCLGTTLKKAGSVEKFRQVDHDLVVDFATLALRSGVKTFLVMSSIGANLLSKNAYLRIKGEMERDLEEIGFESLVIFRPSLLLGKRSEKRFLESIAISLFPFYRVFFRGFLKEKMPISARRVAERILQFVHESSQGTRRVSNLELLDEG